MHFGITIKPDMTVERIVASHAPGRSCGLRIRLDLRFPCPVARAVSDAHADGGKHANACGSAPASTNPATRDITVTASLFATLNLISGGRMQTGHRTRRQFAPRARQKACDAWSQLEQSVKRFSRADQLETRSTTKADPRSLHWASGGTPPVWVAGYGPKVLEHGRPRCRWHYSCSSPILT